MFFITLFRLLTLFPVSSIRGQLRVGTGSKGSKSSQNRVKRARKQALPGPKGPGTLGTRVPGPIQHLSLRTREGLWLPGENSRRYSNEEAGWPPYPVPARTQRAALSPGHRFFPLYVTACTGPGRRHCTAVYPGVTVWP